jgi:hypothetical protein
VKAWYVLDGVRVTPGHTFPNEGQADEWLKGEWSCRRTGTWADTRGKLTLREFVDEVWWPTKVDRHLRVQSVVPTFGPGLVRSRPNTLDAISVLAQHVGEQVAEEPIQLLGWETPNDLGLSVDLPALVNRDRSRTGAGRTDTAKSSLAK